MKLTYKFLEEKNVVIDVEVSDEVSKVLEKTRKKEAANNRRYERHNWSMGNKKYEGLDYAEYDEYIFIEEEIREHEEQTHRIENAMSHLTESQKRRLLLYANGKSYDEIAEIENISDIAAFRSVKRAIERFKEFF